VIDEGLMRRRDSNWTIKGEEILIDYKVWICQSVEK